MILPHLIVVERKFLFLRKYYTMDMSSKAVIICTHVWILKAKQAIYSILQSFGLNYKLHI